MKEPFLINPYLGIINRPKKKGKKSMARRRGRRKSSMKSHMAYVRSFRKKARKAAPRRARRRRHSRNPYPVAGAVVANPRRRRGRKNAPRRARRRHSRGYSRNPKMFGFELPNFSKVAYGGAGFILTPIAEGFINGYLPASLQGNTIAKYAVKIGSVVGLSLLARKFLGREAGNAVGVGGGVYVATSLANEFLPNIPAMFGLTAPVTAVPASTVKAYVPAARQLSAYVQPNQRVFNGMGMPSAAFFNNDASGAQGGSAARFRRF